MSAKKVRIGFAGVGFMGQMAHLQGVEAMGIDIDRHLNTAPIRQVGDIPVVPHISLQLEGNTCFLGFKDVTAVLVAPAADSRVFCFQVVGRLELFCQHAAVVVIRPRLTTKGRLVTIGRQPPIAAAEPRQVF